jgi:hypothetical protein
MLLEAFEALSMAIAVDVRPAPSLDIVLCCV